MKKTVLLLIPLTFRGITLTNCDFDKSYWNTNGKHWFTTVIPETFAMGYVRPSQVYPFLIVHVNSLQKVTFGTNHSIYINNFIKQTKL